MCRGMLVNIYTDACMCFNYMVFERVVCTGCASACVCETRKYIVCMYVYILVYVCMFGHEYVYVYVQVCMSISDVCTIS